MSLASGVRPALAARAHEAWSQFRLMFRNNLAKAAFVLVAIEIVVALAAPILVPYPKDVAGATHPESKLESPSLSHPFGTDELGRDIFSRILWGTRISLGAACAAIGLALLIGVPLGALAGGIGGTIDDVIMRVTDIFLSFPSILLAIIVAAFLGPSLRNAILAIVISWWPWYTRLLRNQAVSLKERQFVRAAKTIGTSRLKIIFRHEVPNAIGPVIVQASLDFGAVILTLAALSFLGLGAQSPTAEWGLMVNMSRNYFLSAWWYMIIPGVVITLTALAFNILGDSAREVLDPRGSRN